MQFEPWLEECKSIIRQRLNYSDELAQKMIDGAGIAVYRAKFDRGLTPQQCIDDETNYWDS